MRIPWLEERCIVCLGTPRQGDPMSKRTDAHVIPKSLGGKLHAPFLCRRCNSKLGKPEGGLPKDVMILGLVDRLDHVLPGALVSSIRKYAGYFADAAEFGRIYASTRRGVLTPRESETIRSERNTLRQIEAELRRHGADEERVMAMLREFVEAEDGTRIEVVPDLVVVKGIPLSELEWRRTYDEPIVSRAVPLGIAYLYLAVCIGDEVYDRPLDPTREALGQAMVDDRTLAESWPFKPMRTAKPPEPKHALAVTQEQDGALVKIWFFRELVWPVPFQGVRLRAPAPFYLLDLTTGDESLT
jgi:hypothetical protein